MKKKILGLFVLLLICCISAAAADNWASGSITADFSVDKDGFNFKKLQLSVTGDVNDYTKIIPSFTFASEDDVEESGFSVTVSIKNDPNEKLGGIFRVLSQIEEYKGMDLTLWFRNPEKGFRAIEFDVTSEFATDKISTKFGFLVSLSGDKSRTDFHFNDNFKLTEITSINLVGKIHYIDKAIRVDDFVSSVDFAKKDNTVENKLHAGISFEYSYDNAPQENGLYATVDLENYKVSKDFYFSVNAKAGAHVIDNAITFDVNKVCVSANFKSTIPMVANGDSSGHCLHFIPEFEYVNNYRNKEEDNGFFANMLIGGLVFSNYKNFTGVSVKLQHYDSIKDLNIKGLSENLFGVPNLQRSTIYD